MNLADLRNRCYRYAGLLDQAQQLDWDYQEINDAINTALEIISTKAPFTFCLLREQQLPITNGVQVYTLNDWALRADSYYTTDQAAHKIKVRKARNADRSGIRNPGLQYTILGPFDATWSPANVVPVLSGDANSGITASAVEGQRTVTFSGSPGFTSAHVGRMFKFNGEYGDYKVVGFGTNSLTLDRNIKSRIAGPGLGSTHIGPGYTNVRWELGPKLRINIMFLPTPTAPSPQVFLRYAALPRRLLNDDDEPELRDEWHHLIYKGAVKELGLRNEDMETYQAYKQEFDETLNKYYAADQEDQDEEDPVSYESNLHSDFSRLPNDVLPPRSWY